MAGRRPDWLPRRPRDWRLVATVLRRVLATPRYAGVALGAGAAVLVAMAVARNLELVVRVVVLGPLPVANRVRVLLELLPFVGTAYEPWAGLAAVALAGLVGVNLAMLAYHLVEHGATLAASAGGSMGATGGVLGGLGAGCAVCGTSLLAGLASLVGGTGGALLESVGGPVLTLLAFALVVLSIGWIAEGMHGGLRRREVYGP